MRYYLAVRMGHGAWGMGHGAWGLGPAGHTSRRLRTAITQVSAGAGLLNFLVCIRDFDEPASR